MKNSKVKAHTLKRLSVEELTRRAQLVADKLATSKDTKAKRAQMIEELVANGYGSKASVSKWKEERLVDTYRKYKAARAANPEKFQTAEASTSVVRTSGVQRRPATQRKKTEEKVKTDFRMVLLEGSTVVHSDFDIEEKPLLTQFRDPSTFAYQIQRTITDKLHTKVTTEHHLPTFQIPNVMEQQQGSESHLRVTEVENIQHSGETQGTTMVPYTADFDKSKVPVIRWSFTDNNSVLVTRRDQTSREYRSMKELKKLSTKDLLTIQHLEPRKGSLTDDQLNQLKNSMFKGIWKIVKDRNEQ